MLTDLQIKKLKCGITKIADNLYLKVLPSGTKIWIFRKMVNKKMTVKTLGHYPDMSLKQARAIVQDMLAKTTIEADEPTFKDIYDKWMEFKSKTVKDFKKIALRFDNILMPHFKKRTFSSIETIEVVNVIKEYTQDWNVKLESARRLAIWLHQMEVYAVNYGYAKFYRFQGITAVIPSPAVKSMSSIHPKELPDFFAKYTKECLKSRLMLDVVLVAFYTLLRPGEYTSLRWSWIDLDKLIITVPSEFMKMKKEHVIPISKQLQSLLNNLKQAKVNDFVFASPSKIDNHIVPESIDKFFRNHGFKGVIVPHGIRSIGRTWMAENDIQHNVAEMCLAHRVGSDVEIAYNRSNLLDKRRVAMQQWCDFVEKCLTSKSGA